jgi:hypothetical protein
MVISASKIIVTRGGVTAPKPLEGGRAGYKKVAVAQVKPQSHTAAKSHIQTYLISRN